MVDKRAVADCLLALCPVIPGSLPRHSRESGNPQGHVLLKTGLADEGERPRARNVNTLWLRTICLPMMIRQRHFALLGIIRTA